MRYGPRTGGDECGSIIRGERVHHVARRRGGVALRHARAVAGADAADRCAYGTRREPPGRTGPCRGVARGTPEARLDGEPQYRIDTRWATADVELMQRFAREIVELQLADKQLGVVFMTTLKLKTLFLILILPALFFLSPICAAEFTYKEYTKASESWRRGFVFGISRYMSTVAQPDEEAPYPVRTAFQRCLGGSTDTLLARHIEAYAASNPGSSNGSMVAVVMRALFDLCRSEIEKTKPANTAPSQRSRP
jgi:hypothetical protein